MCDPKIFLYSFQEFYDAFLHATWTKNHLIDLRFSSSTTRTIYTLSLCCLIRCFCKNANKQAKHALPLEQRWFVVRVCFALDDKIQELKNRLTQPIDRLWFRIYYPENKLNDLIQQCVFHVLSFDPQTFMQTFHIPSIGNLYDRQVCIYDDKTQQVIPTLNTFQKALPAELTRASDLEEPQILHPARQSTSGNSVHSHTGLLSEDRH